jgi:long-chain acyl-CoA synthetase
MKEYVFTRFEKACERFGNRPAVIYLGQQYSFLTLRQLIAKFATALHSLGIRDNDRALLYLPNCVQWIVAYFGLQKIGGVPVPISPAYTMHEIESMASDSGAKVAICQDTNFGYIQQLRGRTAIEKVIVTNLVDLLPAWKRALGFLLNKVPRGRVESGEAVYSFRDLLRKHPPRPPRVEMDPDEHLAYILYTGGTTGFPKGVPGTHTSMVSFVNDLTDGVERHITPGKDAFVLVNPLFHIMAKGMFMTLGLNTGCTTVIMPEPQVDAILEVIQRNRVSLMLGVPALYRMILENDRLDTYDLSSGLRFHGGRLRLDEPVG